MSDALSTIGSAAVTTMGTVAVVGATAKVVGKAIGGGGGGSRKKNYNVWNKGSKHQSKHRSSKKSMMSF